MYLSYHSVRFVLLYVLIIDIVFILLLMCCEQWLITKWDHIKLFAHQWNVLN